MIMGKEARQILQLQEAAYDAVRSIYLDFHRTTGGSKYDVRPVVGTSIHFEMTQDLDVCLYSNNAELAALRSAILGDAGEEHITKRGLVMAPFSPSPTFARS